MGKTLDEYKRKRRKRFGVKGAFLKSSLTADEQPMSAEMAPPEPKTLKLRKIFIELMLYLLFFNETNYIIIISTYDNLVSGFPVSPHICIV